MKKEEIYFQPGETPDWHDKQSVTEYLMDVQMGARSCRKAAEVIVQAFDDFNQAYVDMADFCKRHGLDPTRLPNGGFLADNAAICGRSSAQGMVETIQEGSE